MDCKNCKNQNNCPRDDIRYAVIYTEAVNLLEAEKKNPGVPKMTEIRFSCDFFENKTVNF